MSATATEVLDVARSWLGYSEANGKHKEIIDLYNSHKPLARSYKVTYTDAWCATFVSACAIKAGAVDIIGTECGCEQFVAIFKKKGIWIEDGSVKPQVGDIILFNWDETKQPNDGWSDHIGFVEEQYGNTIICIEGNKSDSVSRRTINLGWGYIRGFARPKYGEEKKTNTATTKPAQTTQTTKPSAKKSVDEIVQEVIRGAWGTGASRKNALTKAGYNYDDIQAKVNDILGKGATKSDTDIAKEVIKGKWGNGDARKTALTKAGYNYFNIQKKVNELL